jgi:CHAT domain-containing protein
MAALVVRRGREPVDPAAPFAHLGAHEYLGERLALTTLFSASLFEEATPRAAEDVGSDFRVIGAPESRTAAPLPGAEAEGLRLSAVRGLSARTFLGPLATEERFRREASSARFIHFASHGVVFDTLPLRSHLVITKDGADDGLLEAREVEEMRLAAELVTLGACDAGGGALEGGEGLAGLTRSFRVAGARRVAASLWPLEDASPLFVELYERVARGEAPLFALRDARRAILDDARRRRSPACHPYFWAGVVLTGPP